MEFLGEESVVFREGLYLWVDLKRFRIPESVESEDDALGQLLAHVQYRDHYASVDSQQDDGLLHGPYWLSRITRDSFKAIDAGEAIATIEGFMGLYGGPAESVKEKVRVLVYPLVDRASAIYRLCDLGEGALHEWGDVLDDFTELVLVDLSRQCLGLVVAAGD